MQFFTIAALAASASAATLGARQDQAQYIIGFQAACVPHSTFCNYKFGVSSEPGTVTPTTCTAMVQGPDYLPAVEDQNSCTVGNITNSVYHWSVEKTAAGGLDFQLWYPLNSRSNLTFCHEIPGKDLKVDNNGAVQTQRYAGPDYFKMDICAPEN
ncbi:hypothetical protein PG996_000096 [Apiospora saccharicola]|uniref:Hypersensitive response-inducing protein n=1 Tax=Apiospora saccharicola TaxID=335842 RepID=A0ABR1WCT4_9PEZI